LLMVHSAEIVEAQEVALLVESSEARAYASLIRAAPEPFLKQHGLLAIPIQSAVAIVAESVTNTLNMNRVIGLGVAEAASEAMIGQIVELYEERGLSFGIEVSPFARPKEIPEWLRARRIRRSVATAMHHRDARPIEARKGKLSVVRAPYSAREIVADICCSVFRMPPAAHALIAGTADRPEWRQWIAYSGNRPAAAALSFVYAGIAWLGWDATLPEFRGQGAQSSLIVHRINDAADVGCKYITTETAINTATSTDSSYRNYKRLGFSCAYERATYISLRVPKRHGTKTS
jgi:GNAT superfamily N-acetyltransferase